MNLKQRAELVDRLGSAIHYGESHIGRVPGLLKELLTEERWKKFETKKGTIVEHNNFEEFVTTKEPYKGLGADDNGLRIIKSIASQDVELGTLLGKALRLPMGNPEKTNQYTANRLIQPISKENNELSQLAFPEKEEEEKPKKKKQERYGRQALKLKKDYPELYAQVLNNEKTINMASIEAGIYPARI